MANKQPGSNKRFYIEKNICCTKFVNLSKKLCLNIIYLNCYNLNISSLICIKIIIAISCTSPLL